MLILIHYYYSIILLSDLASSQFQSGISKFEHLQHSILDNK